MTRHFHLISQLDVVDFLQSKDWLVKIDLHQAYFHLCIAETHRRFLRVIYNGEVLQLTALPFGLSSAPRTFAAVSNWVAETLRKRGIRVIVYLDDYLLACQDRSRLMAQVAETLACLESLGWHVNYQKSVIEPIQEVEYLGLVWNTLNQTLALPTQKVLRIKASLTRILSQNNCSLKELQSLLGMLNFANQAVTQGRLHCRRAQLFLRKFTHRGQRRELCPNVQQELRWWLDAVDCNPTPLHKKEITHFLTTDAADAGWGAHLNNQYLSGKWAAHQRSWHSNMKEMYAVFAAMKSQAVLLKNAHIMVQSDNRTLVAYIRNQGGTRSIRLLTLTTRLLDLTSTLNITMTAYHLPGILNGIADRLSRGKPVPEWHLLPTATEAIFRRWGVPQYCVICNKRDRCRSSLCNTRLKRWIFSFLRRLQPKVGVSDRVGVPTSQHDTESPCTSQQCNRNILLDCPSVDTMLLVPGPGGASSHQPLAHSESEAGIGRLDNRNEPSTGRQVVPSGLESWGWANQIKDWSKEEKQLLKESWRPSTLNTYNAPLKRWMQWCKANNIQSKSPEGKDVARFLASLYLENKFAYSTILLHKSAISTYCATTVKDLSKDFFIQQVLRAISYFKPQPPRTPIWDVNILFNWLRSSSCSETLFDKSRRTALILLLASGRRLHDLTLLELSEGRFTDTDSTVTFWPKFGSKTDTGTHRQSGWLLMQHEDRSICPVTHVKELIKASQTRRSKDREIRSLFISITGVLRPASRTMIAGWLRSVFKLAKIDASPGSIRSAVASRGWLDNRPVEEILDRGNWKCVETFSKYYCREVNRSSSDCAGLYNNFKTV